MATERIDRDSSFLDKEISARLAPPHHAFVDEMKKNMRPGVFLKFLTTTQDRFGNLEASGTVPIYLDTILPATGEPIPHTFDAILQTQELIDDLKALGTTDENCQKVREAAYFAIWAHGTNPKENMRTRHSGEPYVLHTIRTAKRIVELEKINDTDIISGALLHDILEDTPYQADDLTQMFGKRVTKYVEFASKLKSQNLSDLAKIDLKLCWQYLNLYRDEPEAEKALKFIERKNLKYSPDSIGAVERWYSTTQDGISLVNSLRLFLGSTEEEQLLTNMRLISLVNDPDDVGGLIIKSADAADNTATLDGLARAKPEKVAGKIHLAETVYLPMANFLGLRGLAREIKDNIFRARYPDRVEKFSNIPHLSDAGIVEIEERFTELMRYFEYWIEDGSKIVKRPLPPGLFTINVRFPTNAEIADNRLTKERLYPLAEISLHDQILAREFLRFLGESDIPGIHGVNPGKITAVDHTGSLASSCGIYLKSIKRRTTVATLFHDDSGSPADIFRAGADDVAKRLGHEKLEQLERSFAAGDLKSAIDILALPMVSVSILRRGQAVSRLIPKGVIGWDTFVLANIYHYGGEIIRDGKPIPASSVLESGDVLVPSRSYADSDLISLDLVATDAARQRLSRVTETIIHDSYRDKDKVIRSEIIRRGKKAAALLIDTYTFRKAAWERRYKTAIGWFVDEKFWQNLFSHHRDLLTDLGSDEAFIRLGLIPLALTDKQYQFSASGYDKWSKYEGVKAWLKNLHQMITTEYIDVLLPESTSDELPIALARCLSPLSVVKERSDRDALSNTIKAEFEATSFDPHKKESISMDKYKIIDRIISLPPGGDRRLYIHLDLPRIKEIIAYLEEDNRYWKTFGKESGRRSITPQERDKLILNKILDIAFTEQWRWVGMFDK